MGTAGDVLAPPGNNKNMRTSRSDDQIEHPCSESEEILGGGTLANMKGEAKKINQKMYIQKPMFKWKTTILSNMG